MTGSLGGHGAAWPLPNVLNAAFHAALHRAFPVGPDDIDGNRTAHGDHVHRPGRGGKPSSEHRALRFGSLVTAGPFPVRNAARGESGDSTGKWYAPRPLDLQDDTLCPSLLPSRRADWPTASSLPRPLRYAVANRLPPSKDRRPKAWLAQSAWQAYLNGADTAIDPSVAADDSDIFDAESTIGIGIDPATETQDGERFYSANYLRLREDWRLGVLASGEGKDENLLARLLTNESRIVVGGQQRICTARRVDLNPSACLPLGRNDGFPSWEGRFLVKWILLSPAVWPAIPASEDNAVRPHAGGWLPNWIEPKNGTVLLKAGDIARNGLPRTDWRAKVRALPPIAARLVAALVPKPLVVTGWSLGTPLSDLPDARGVGAKSTLLAVPAGAVYYFEADSESAARDLAAALNWHGGGRGDRIVGIEEAYRILAVWDGREDVTGNRPSDLHGLIRLLKQRGKALGVLLADSSLAN
jgi:hypothetical protein